MKGLLDRLERLESQQRLLAYDLSAAERAGLAADIDRVLALAPPGIDLDAFYLQMLARLDSGFATDEELARVGGVNIEVLRVVSKMQGSC